MPSRVCSFCGKAYTISRRHERHLHQRLTYFCSAACLGNQIITTPEAKTATGYSIFKQDSSALVNDPYAVWDSFHDRFFRSKYEQMFANFLDYLEVEWEYESHFFLVGRTIYVPDFYLPKKDIFVEVKGFWLSSSRSKMTSFVNSYPNISVLLVPWTLRHGIEGYIKEYNIGKNRNRISTKL